MAVLIERTIVDAHIQIDDHGYEWWAVVTENPDGTFHAYMLPSVTFDNLCAEYGLDENDIDELLRIAMLQIHIPDWTIHSSHESDVAAKKGMIRDGKPIYLGNADSVNDAREAHMARVNWVENNKVKIHWPESPQAMRMSHLGEEVNPHSRLEALKSTYVPKMDRIARRKEMLWGGEKADGRQ